MPIISKVEARSWRGKCIYAAIIVFLTLGGVTMVYPFIIMVSGTLRSEMDEKDLDLIPQYMVDDQVLYRKFLETKYNQKVDHLSRGHGRLNFSFSRAAVPDKLIVKQADDLERFWRQTRLPRSWQALGGVEGIKTVPEELRKLTTRVRERFNGDLDALGRAVGATLPNWDLRGFRMPDWLNVAYDYADNAIFDEHFIMAEQSPLAKRQLMSVSGYFVETMLIPVYGRKDHQNYNNAHVRKLEPIGPFAPQAAGADDDSDSGAPGAAGPDNPQRRELAFKDYVLLRTVPGEDQPKLRDEWIEFVTKQLNPSFTTLRGVPDSAYQAYLKQKYETPEQLSRNWGRSISRFDEVALPKGRWLSGAARQDFVDFRAQQPIERYVLVGPEYAWRDWLSEQYQSLAALNTSHQTDYASFDQVRLPIDQLELKYVLANTGALRWTFAIRNFVNVYDALFIRGRAFLNTIIFCALSVLVAMIINPLAAYALSRFKLPGTYKFLLILMATISFPPMVAMIPTFIMLRELNMLNTFWALVLPGAANGYMIFLLKGFFDSLPEELYDAALIDGAGEIRMFFQITMALSKPILAVVALGAFNGAYLMFLYALVVCPSEDMWLLSVWLFQYQTQVGMGGMFASVLVAAIPPLLIFVLAQNIIMRGIVVPVER